MDSDKQLEYGRVKWFNDAKGFGFIERSNSEAVFAHFSAIDLNEDDDSSKFLQSLKEGDRVCFNLVQGPKGMQATNI